MYSPGSGPEHPLLTRQPALDGLRGLAVAGVLLFHGGRLSGGFLGVDLFFVLSGFLISSLLLAEARPHGRIALGAFWMRRARRLLPALVCVLAAVAVYARFLARPDELSAIRGDALATIGYFANWRAIFTSSDYWALFRSPSPLNHTWSLAIEEQFYLVWPLLVVAVVRGRGHRIGAKRVFALSIALAAVSLIWMLVIFDPANPSRVYFGTDTRLASILLGAALAALLALRGPVRAPRARIALELAAVAALIGLTVAFTRLSGSSDVLYRGGLFACALAVVVVIAAAVHPRPGPVRRLLSFRPLCGLGLLSYGIYLWHWPIYVVINESRTHLRGWPLLAVRVGVTLVIAGISFRVVEQPIRNRACAPPTARRVTIALATVAAVVVAVVATTASAPARPELVADRIRPPTPPPLAQQAAAVAKKPPVTGQPVRGKVVALAPDMRPRRVLVVGNSVALYTGDEGFKRLRTKPALDVLNLGSTGCRLLPQETRIREVSGDVFQDQGVVCRENWEDAVAIFRPDVVVVLVADPGEPEREINGQWTEPCERAYDDVFERELREQIRILAANGARVLVTTTAYSFPYNTSTSFRHNDCQNAIIRRVGTSEPQAVLADIFEWMCPQIGANCETQREGVVLRPDGVHFREASAIVLAEWLIAQMQHHGVLAGVHLQSPEAGTVAVRPST